MRKSARILLIFLLLILLAPIADARRGGGGGGFFRRSSPPISSWSGGSGGLGFPSFVFFGFGGSPVVIIGMITFVVIVSMLKKRKQASEKEGTVFHLRLGFFFGDGELQRKLMGILDSVDTGTQEGVKVLLREGALAMKRHWEKVRWFQFDKENCSSQYQMESRFQKRVTQERLKLEKEEYTNIQGRRAATERPESENLEEIIVVNIIVAAFEDVMVKKAVRATDVAKVLEFFASLPGSQMAGANIWWNIMDRDDMLELYPEMRSL